MFLISLHINTVSQDFNEIIMPMTEFEIIEQYFKKKISPAPGIVEGIGDDAALLKVPEGHILAVSTDTLINGVHFPVNTSAYDIGYKSLAVNLSDMAAMGASPLWTTLSLTLPDNDELWISEFSKGFIDLANLYGVSLVGGDLSHGAMTITVQIMGSIPEGSEIKRSGAVPGDSIYVTGYLGMASYSLSILMGEQPEIRYPPEDCINKLNRPDPRVKIGIALRKLASAAIDISDGLAADLGHLLKSSSVGAEINLQMLPVHEALNHMPEDKIRVYCLNRGDDYELCFTTDHCNHETVKKISKEFGCHITRIGKIINGRGLNWIASNAEKIELDNNGYRHF